MFSRTLLRLAAMLIGMSGLLASLGCNSGSNNTMVGASGAKSNAASTNSAETEPPGQQSEPLLTEPDEPAVSATAAEAVTVQVADRAGLDGLLAKHKGEVVLVDYWASWCPPCRKKFPHTVALANAHKADGLTVISIAMDDEDAHEDVLKFLTEQRAAFINLRSQQGGSEEAFDAFEIPGGTLPCLRLFDRDGKVLKTFAIDENATKQFTDEDVAEAVKAALAK